LGKYLHDDRAIRDSHRNEFRDRIFATTKLFDEGDFWTDGIPCLTMNALLHTIDPLNDVISDRWGDPVPESV
jgi:hypothetical protein